MKIYMYLVSICKAHTYIYTPYSVVILARRTLSRTACQMFSEVSVLVSLLH